VEWACPARPPTYPGSTSRAISVQLPTDKSSHPGAPSNHFSTRVRDLPACTTAARQEAWRPRTVSTGSSGEPCPDVAAQRLSIRLRSAVSGADPPGPAPRTNERRSPTGAPAHFVGDGRSHPRRSPRRRHRQPRQWVDAARHTSISACGLPARPCARHHRKGNRLSYWAAGPAPQRRIAAIGKQARSRHNPGEVSGAQSIRTG
jgi:hypothetical protein